MKAATGRSKSTQQGALLLEALVSILIFSVGILSLVSFQAASVRNTMNSTFRSTAGILADRLVASMWTNKADLASFALEKSSDCPESPKRPVDIWLCEVQQSLPGSRGEGAPTVEVSPDGVVTVTVRWKLPSNNSLNIFRLVSQITD